MLFNGSGLAGQKKYPKILISTLITQLKHENNSVREAALNTIGNIGMPFVESAKHIV